MMKTTVKQVALVALFLCFSSAEGLQCMSCSDVSCSSQTSVNCSSQQQCLSTSVSDFYQTLNFSGIEKRCASSIDCSASRTQAFSYKLGSYSFLSNTSCCDSDNCNSANITNLAPPAGFLQCYSCDPFTFECSNVTCASGQLCAHVTFGDGSETLYGCFSQNLCGLSEVFDNNTFLTCCNTSNCNAPGLGLQCMTCTDASCSSQYSVSCSIQTTTCYSVFFSVFSRSENITSPNTYIYKGCGTPSDCTAAGSPVASYNFGSYTYLRNITCCNSDNCNSNITMEPPAGSLQCYGCDPFTYECSGNVSCNSEEVCASDPLYGSLALYGCVSQNLCGNSSLSLQVLGSNESLTCCNTSFCNVPAPRLRCMTCTDASCSSQHSVLCSIQSTTCYSVFFSVFSRSENITSTNIYIFKGCGTPNIRPDTEGQFVSFNYGPYSLLTNTTRCDTDNCNSANITMEPPAGSLQCYGCDPNTFKCTNVSCNSEEVCASVHYNSKVFYGCVSENLCEKNSSLPQQFFYNPQLVSCCNTSYCIVPPSRPTVPGVYTTVPGLPTTVPPGQTTTATHCDEDEDSVFCAAGPGLSLRWFISLMGFCIFTHTLFF